MTAPRDVKVVQRWDFRSDYSDNGMGYMIKDSTGDYVLQSDHARALADVEAENERLRGQIFDLEGAVGAMRRTRDEMQRTIRRQEDALAAATARCEYVIGAARVYFGRYCQDEASEDGPRWTGCSEDQHKDAADLGAALAAYDALAGKGAGS